MDKLKKLPIKLITAGGLVINREGKVLLIHRKGQWDLPKGKIDKGETFKQTALREVSEETGAIEKKLSIIRPLISTQYKSKQLNKRLTKRTAWYLMFYKGTEKLTVPKQDEKIDKVKWVDISELDKYIQKGRNYMKPLFDYWLGYKIKLKIA